MKADNKKAFTVGADKVKAKAVDLRKALGIDFAQQGQSEK